MNATATDVTANLFVTFFFVIVIAGLLFVVLNDQVDKVVNPPKDPFTIPQPSQGPLTQETVCGDSICDVSETVLSCATDCRTEQDFFCGDRICTSGESYYNCPSDCSFACGNNLCEARENETNCPADCAEPGDEYYYPPPENDSGQDEDDEAEDEEPPSCGDTICNNNETCETCSADCGDCPVYNSCIENGGECYAACGEGFEHLSGGDSQCAPQICCIKADKTCEGDTDNDGLPDCWEEDYFDNITQYNGSSDPDNDAFSNLSEYTTGTHPMQADTDGDTFNDSADFYPINMNRWMNIPQSCPHVTVDKNRGLVVDGGSFFPIGFWGFYKNISGSWPEYVSHFSGAVDGGESFLDDASRNHSLKHFLQLSGHTDYVDVRESNRGVFAWEPIHEPNNGVPLEELRAMVDDIRARDECKRPVFVTPTAGATGSGYLAQIRDFIDIGIAQGGYGPPRLKIGGAGSLVKTAYSDMGAGKPAMLVTSVPGYQSVRYRYYMREKTAQELRVQAFDAIVSGAKGIFFWNYSAGSADTGDHGFYEKSDSAYNIEDSSGFFAGVKDLGDELKSFSYIFTSPFSSSVQVSDDHAWVNCASFDVNENSQIIPYLVCVNISQQDSDYFDAVSGNVVWRPNARVVTTDGKVFPEYTCRDGYDNDEDGLVDYPADTDCAKAEDDEYGDSNPYRYRDRLLDPDLLTMQDVYMGITNQTRQLDSVRIYFVSSPQGANFTYAIYEDDLRDDGPNRRVFLSEPTPVPTTAGEYSFPVTGITLQHTKKYYLMVKSDREGVMIREKDSRYGVRIKDATPEDRNYVPIEGPIPFDETFSLLHVGVAASARISLSGGPFTSYCVWKTQGGDCSNQTLNGSSFSENFGEYGVHIYKLIK